MGDVIKINQPPHGCLECAEVNQGFEYINEELGLKVCTCGKQSKVLDLQEAFDYIKHLTRKLELKDIDELEETEADLQELNFDDD